MTEDHILDREDIKIIGREWPDDNISRGWANMTIEVRDSEGRKVRGRKPALNPQQKADVRSFASDALFYQDKMIELIDQIKVLKLKHHFVAATKCAEQLELKLTDVKSEYTSFGYHSARIAIPTIGNIIAEYNEKHGIDQDESNAT